jgi:hypothetical protein
MLQTATAIARRRRAAKEVLKLVGIVAAVFAVYFVLPLDFFARLPLGVTLPVGLVVLGAVSAWEVLAVMDADRPSVRAAEALVKVIPLFLVLFATAYYLMQQTDPSRFSSPMTRSDSLYLTVTIFSTVGFGDIVATSEVSRDTVTCQMILDLVILGLGVRVLTRAVQVGTERKKAPAEGVEPDPGTGASLGEGHVEPTDP